MSRSVVIILTVVTLLAGCKDASLEPKARELPALAELVAAEKNCRQAYDAEETPAALRAWINSLAQLGWGYANEEQDENAVVPYRTAIANLPEEITQDNPEFVARLHDGLGRALQNCGEFAEAEQHLAEGLKIWSAIPGAETEVGVSEGHLGLLHLVRGRYAEAERLFHSAYEHTPEEERGLLAHRHDCFGRYYLAIRAHQLAAEHFALAIEHASADGQDDDALLLELRTNYALCTFRGGDSDGALSEIAALLATDSGHPESPLRRAGLLNLRGTIRAEERQFEKGAADIEEAWKIVSHERGEAHPAVAPFLTNLGATRLRAGHADQALAPLEEALPILVGSVEDHHQALVELYYLIADCRLALADSDQAREAVLVARRAADALMAELIAGGSERELLNFWQKVDLHSIVCQLGDPGLIAESLLNGKGRIMEAILERRSVSLKGIPELAQLRGERDRLRLEDPDRHAKRIAELEKKLRELNGDGEEVQGREGVRWEQIRDGLPKGAVFIDCARYQSRDESERPARYGAVVIVPEHEPLWVPLAEENMMGRLSLLHRSLETRAHIIRTGGGQPGVAMAPLLSLLYEYFWQPIAEVLPEGTQEVILSPEGRMHLLPYAVLRNPGGGFLCEELPALRLVDSGRALIRSGDDSSGERAGWVVLGVSDFAPYRKELRGGSKLWPPRWAEEFEKLSDLPTVEKELESLRRLAPQNSQFLLNRKAAASALRTLPAPPAVLHLASHGFHVRLGGSGDLAADPSALYENGVLLGLVRGDDGILFPEEVAALDLRGTQLVTLSTCRSAIGRSVSGEGLLGLRRGFTKAGARNILASLWEIPDRSTAEFMERFYTEIAKDIDPGEALWGLQAERFKALREVDAGGPEMETAILSFGGFVLSSPSG